MDAVHSDSDIVLWFQDNYEESAVGRITCESLLQFAKAVWPNANNRQMGKCIRKAFPALKRVRSNSVYYYEKLIKRFERNEQNPLSTSVPRRENEQLSSISAAYSSTCDQTNQDLADLPKIFHLRREMLQFSNEDPQQNRFAFGSSSILLLARYEGIDVIVKQLNEDMPFSRVKSEALVTCNLGLHESLPLLLGVVTNDKPYWIVYKFYGSMNVKTSTSLTNCPNLGCGKFTPSIWISLIIAIAKGVAHFHQHGYLHGSVNADHVIVYPDIFGNNCQYKIKIVGLGNCSKNNEADKITEEIFSLGQLINGVYQRLEQKHPSLSYLVSRTINRRKKSRPSAQEIAEKFQYIYESGHFGDENDILTEH